MADIISKIILQAQGGDSVAREIGKIKKAYDETGESAKRIQPSGIGSGVAPQEPVIDQGAAAAERRIINENLIKNKTVVPPAGTSLTETTTPKIDTRTQSKVQVPALGEGVTDTEVSTDSFGEKLKKIIQSQKDKLQRFIDQLIPEKVELENKPIVSGIPERVELGQNISAGFAGRDLLTPIPQPIDPFKPIEQFTQVPKIDEKIEPVEPFKPVEPIEPLEPLEPTEFIEKLKNEIKTQKDKTQQFIDQSVPDDVKFENMPTVSGKVQEPDDLMQSIKNLKKVFDELGDSVKKIKSTDDTAVFERVTEPKTPEPAGIPSTTPVLPPKPGFPEPVPTVPTVPSTRTGTLSPNTFTRNAASMFNAVGQFGAGNTAGAVGTGAQAATGMLGVGASAAMLGVAGMMAVNQLAKGDLELRKQLVFSGLAQRLGKKSYSEITAPVLAMGEQGYESTAMPMLQALATSGAKSDVTTVRDTTGKSPLQELLEMQYKTGMDSTVIGKLYGTLQSAGGGGATVYQEGDTARAAQSSFGESRSTEFLATVTAGVQRAMTAGMEKSAKTFGENAYDLFVKPLRDLSIRGNISPEAASGIYGKVQDTMLGTARGIQSPEDTMQFMMFRKEGESYFDTLRRMASPESETERYRNMQGMSGGSQDVLTHLIMQSMGLNVFEADAYRKSLDRRVLIDDAQKAGVIDATTGTVIRPETGMDDESLRRAAAAYATERAKNTLSDAAGGLKAGVIEFLQKGFGPVLSPEARQMNDQIKQINKSKSKIYSDIKEDVGDYVPSSKFLQSFDPSVATFAQTAYTGMSAGEFGPEAMRYLIKHGNARERAVALRNNPVTGEGGMLTELGAYQQWKSGAEVNPAENEYFKVHSGKFDYAQKLISDNSDYLRTNSGMTELINALRDINSSKQFDKDTNFLSIAEVLQALLTVLEKPDTKAYTPSEGTE